MVFYSHPAVHWRHGAQKRSIVSFLKSDQIHRDRPFQFRVTSAGRFLDFCCSASLAILPSYTGKLRKMCGGATVAGQTLGREYHQP